MQQPSDGPTGMTPNEGHHASEKGAATAAQKSQAEAGRRLVYFAAERTLLSWMRTAAGLMAFGFAVDRFGLFLQYLRSDRSAAMGPLSSYQWMGLLLVVTGLAMLGVAAVRYYRFAVHYRREARTEPGSGLTLAVLFILLISATVCVLIVIFIDVHRRCSLFAFDRAAGLRVDMDQIVAG